MYCLISYFDKVNDGDILLVNTKGNYYLAYVLMSKLKRYRRWDTGNFEFYSDLLPVEIDGKYIELKENSRLIIGKINHRSLNLVKLLKNINNDELSRFLESGKGLVTLRYGEKPSIPSIKIEPDIANTIKSHKFFTKNKRNKSVHFNPEDIVDESKQKEFKNKKEYIRALIEFFNKKFFKNKLNLTLKFKNFSEYQHIGGYYSYSNKLIVMDPSKCYRYIILHEMCHAAQHQISGETAIDATGGHTHTWRMWMKKVGQNPEIHSRGRYNKKRQPLKIDKFKVCYPFVNTTEDNEDRWYGYIAKIKNDSYIIMTMDGNVVIDKSLAKAPMRTPDEQELANIKENFDWSEIKNKKLKDFNYLGDYCFDEDEFKDIENKRISELVNKPV